MADLVVALQRAPDSRRLGALLSRALGDPTLELVYWLPSFECYADASGGPVALPAGNPRRAVTPIEHEGERVAALVHDAALTYEPELLEVVRAAADVALERRRLEAELESRVEELAGSRARLVAAGDEERRQIERDLHDGAQQRLVSLAIALRLTEDSLREDPEAAVGLVAAARKEVSESLEELRELARGVHPAVLEHGLDVALESLASRSRTPVSVVCELDERLPRPTQLAAYFVASEALANLGKHARASRGHDPGVPDR
jgi:signal transduction histidine kinase